MRFRASIALLLATSCISLALLFFCSLTTQQHLRVPCSSFSPSPIPASSDLQLNCPKRIFLLDKRLHSRFPTEDEPQNRWSPIENSQSWLCLDRTVGWCRCLGHVPAKEMEILSFYQRFMVDCICMAQWADVLFLFVCKSRSVPKILIEYLDTDRVMILQ